MLVPLSCVFLALCVICVWFRVKVGLFVAFSFVCVGEFVWFRGENLGFLLVPLLCGVVCIVWFREKLGFFLGAPFVFARGFAYGSLEKR